MISLLKRLISKFWFFTSSIYSNIRYNASIINHQSHFTLQMFLFLLKYIKIFKFSVQIGHVNGDLTTFYSQKQGCARFPKFKQNFSERQILWSLCSVVFHTFTLQLPIQTPELHIFVSSLVKCQNFSKTSTTQDSFS